MSGAWDDRKKALEEEHFRRKEQEALEKLRQQMSAETEGAQKQTAVALQCPKCDGTLETINFEDVQIDRCNNCQGVWLDAGELEHLTKRESGGWFSRFRHSMSSNE